MNTLSVKQLSHFKAKARSYANVMLRRGRIQRCICAVCGDPEAQMHHTDYTKPMQVYWLCRQCHIDLHKAAKSYRQFSAELDTAFDLGKS